MDCRATASPLNTPGANWQRGRVPPVDGEVLPSFSTFGANWERRRCVSPACDSVALRRSPIARRKVSPVAAARLAGSGSRDRASARGAGAVEGTAASYPQLNH